MGVLNKIGVGLSNLFVFFWDSTLFMLNLVTPKLKPGQVVPKGAPGHHQIWPEYVPPKATDSRSPCPMLNALANHGILPHDGKNIPFGEIYTTVRQTFNFAPSFCFFVPHFSAGFLNKSYWNDRFDLAELSLHSETAIEHDASLTRQDAALVPDQSKPDLQLVQNLLEEASAKMPDGSPRLIISDVSRALSKRRTVSRRTNKAFTDSFFHKIFGSSNSSTMLTIFGGSIDDLTPILTEERFPKNWEPRILDRYGLTMVKFNGTVLSIELGVDEKKFQ